MNREELPTKTQKEYIRRIDKSLEYIENHLEHPVQLIDIARASHLSTYHFHPVYYFVLFFVKNQNSKAKNINPA